MRFTENVNKQYGFLVNIEQRVNPKNNETYYRFEVILGNGQIVSCLANVAQHQQIVAEGLHEGSLVNVVFSKNDNGYLTITEMDHVTVVPKKQVASISSILGS